MEDLRFFGDPIPREEFIYNYMELFLVAIKRLCHIEEFNPKEKELAYAEKRHIGFTYDKFEYQYKRAPDYNFLSDCVTNGVIERQYLYERREKEGMTAESYADCYIYKLKQEKGLNVQRYGEHISEIVKAERYRAMKEYAKEDRFVEGYESDRIQNNRFLQSRLLEKLADGFFDLYREYQVKDYERSG